MPTILRKNGFHFFFFMAEPEFKEPHIHVKYGSGIAIFWLKPVLLQKMRGFSSKELAKAKIIVIEYQDHFMEKYIEQFGKKNR